MTRRWKSVTVPVIVALILAVILGGCTSIPTSGIIRHKHRSAAAADEDHSLRKPPKPGRGDNASQVVKGFLEAMKSQPPESNAASAYLSERVKDTWRPKGVKVLSDNGEIEQLSRIDASFTATVGAEIEQDGTWNSAPKEPDLKLRFTLVSESEGLRIANPPPSLLVPDDELDTTYEQYDLFFVGLDGTIMVPESVYIPKGQRIETRLVNALLGGPSKWLRPVAKSAFPDGIRLASSVVQVEDRTVTVDLDERFLRLRAVDQQLAADQLAWTLGQRGIDRVRITVRGEAVKIGESKDVARSTDRDPTVNPAVKDPYAVNGGYVVKVLSQETPQVNGLGEAVKDPRMVASAISPAPPQRDADREPLSDAPMSYAWVTKDGRDVYIHNTPDKGQTGRPPKLVYHGANVRSLSWDRLGALWILDSTSTGSKLFVVGDSSDGESSKPRQVSAPELAGATVQVARISRDGARIAVIAERGKRSELLVGRVERGAKLTVDGFRKVPLQLTNLLDVGWSDSLELTVLGRRGAAQSEILRTSVDGSEQEAVEVERGATAIAVAPKLPIIVVSEGVLRRQPDPEDVYSYYWNRIGPGRSPAYPG